MSRLTFYPKSHRYKLDGKWVPGVTTILGNGLPKKALMYWSAKQVAEYVADNPDGVETLRAMGRGPMVNALKEIPWQKRDDAADRGTVVHAILEQAIAGNEVEVPEAVAGYVEAGIAFLDDWGVEPVVVERPHFHAEHKWAGTPDVIGRLRDGRLAIIDYKSSASGIWPETCLQLAAYANATHYQDQQGNDVPALDPEVGIAVQVRPDGYSAYEMRIDSEVYKRFRHIAVVAQTVTDMKDGWMSDELTAPTSEDTAA